MNCLLLFTSPLPTKSTKGIPYNVPGQWITRFFDKGRILNINNLAARTRGTITKILPALRNQNIQRDDIIIVCALDDVVYIEGYF